MKIIKQILSVLVYFAVWYCITSIIPSVLFVPCSYVFLLLTVPYFYKTFELIMIKKDSKKASSRYKEIEKIYGNKKNRYNELYNYLHPLYTSKEIDDRIFLRTIKANYTTDNMTLPILGTIVAVFTILFDKTEYVFLTMINVTISLLNLQGYVNEIVTRNFIGIFYINSIVILFIMVKKISYAISIKTYVNQVQQDIEKDLEFHR